MRMAGLTSPLPTISGTSSKFFSTMITATSARIRPHRHFGELQSQLGERRDGRRRIKLRWRPERNQIGDALAVQRLTEQSARRLFAGLPRFLKQPNHDNAILSKRKRKGDHDRSNQFDLGKPESNSGRLPSPLYFQPAHGSFWFSFSRSEEHTSELQSHSFISYAV